MTCRVIKLARQPYYRWLANPVTQADLDPAHRANALFDAHRDDPEFGYRFLLDEADAAGQSMSARTAWRIGSANQWWSRFGKTRRGKRGRTGPPVYDDLVERDFTATAANELWLTDITRGYLPLAGAHWTGEGKLYLCAIKDVFCGRIVGYSIDDRMKFRLAVNALQSALPDALPESGSAATAIAGCVVGHVVGVEP